MIFLINGKTLKASIIVNTGVTDPRKETKRKKITNVKFYRKRFNGPSFEDTAF